jgi:hypothetical protein
VDVVGEQQQRLLFRKVDDQPVQAVQVREQPILGAGLDGCGREDGRRGFRATAERRRPAPRRGPRCHAGDLSLGKSLECVGGGACCAGGGESGGNPLGAGLLGHRKADLAAQPVGVELARAESGAGVGDLDSAGDLQLVSPEQASSAARTR